MADWLIGACIGVVMIVITNSMPLVLQGSTGLALGVGVMSLLSWLKSTDPG